MMKKNKSISFILSLFPGFGQMYMGYIARGLVYSILVVASFIIMLMFAQGEYNFGPRAGIFFLVMVITWLVSIVDGMILRDRMFRRDSAKNIYTHAVEANDQYPAVERVAVHPAAPTPINNRKLLAIVFSIFPGAGHMYMGLMVQGIQIMALFLGCFYFSQLLGDSLFMFFIPIIWFYGMFDAMQKVSRDEVQDDDILFISWLKLSGMGNTNAYKAVGVFFIFVGVLALANRIAAPMVTRFLNTWYQGDYSYGGDSSLYNIRSYMQTGILVVAFLLGGVKLLQASRRKGNEE